MKLGPRKAWKVVYGMLDPSWEGERECEVIFTDHVTALEFYELLRMLEACRSGRVEQLDIPAWERQTVGEVFHVLKPEYRPCSTPSSPSS